MPNSPFFRKRLQAYADNIIASLLILGVSVGVTFLIQKYGPRLGIDPKAAITVAWLVALAVISDN
jgi:hypothetical protein